MILFACDIGGTRIKLGLIQGRDCLARREIDSHPSLGLGPALRRLAAELDAMLDEGGVPREALGGLALTFPGIIEPGTLQILSTPAGKFDDAPTLHLMDEAARALCLPVFVCNDANAALAGEWRFGAARGVRNVVMVTLGTGIGSSVIIEGVPLRGAHGQAGCLGGHLLANIDGRPCICGAVGCAEAEASTWVLPEIARARAGFAGSALAGEETIDFAAVFRCARAGDPVSQGVRDHCLRVWGGSIVSLIHAYDPERIILGGGVLRTAELVLAGVRTYVDRHAWTPWGKVEIVPATLGNDAGLFGVASLAAEYFNHHENLELR